MRSLEQGYGEAQSAPTNNGVSTGNYLNAPRRESNIKADGQLLFRESGRIVLSFRPNILLK